MHLCIVVLSFAVMTSVMAFTLPSGPTEFNNSITLPSIPKSYVPVYDESMSVRLRNSYHPIRFHDVHSEHIKLSKNKSVAYREEGTYHGIVFSDRPVAISEPIYIKFLETSSKWRGAIKIGFTMNDPVSMKSKLPRYSQPVLNPWDGYWLTAVEKEYAKKDSVLHYYVDPFGDIHYGNGFEEYGIIYRGVSTYGKLWAVLDIFGITAAVEFLGTGRIRTKIVL